MRIHSQASSKCILVSLFTYTSVTWKLKFYSGIESTKRQNILRSNLIRFSAGFYFKQRIKLSEEKFCFVCLNISILLYENLEKFDIVENSILIKVERIRFDIDNEIGINAAYFNPESSVEFNYLDEANRTEFIISFGSRTISNWDTLLQLSIDYKRKDLHSLCLW